MRLWTFVLIAFLAFGIAACGERQPLPRTDGPAWILLASTAVPTLEDS